MGGSGSTQVLADLYEELRSDLWSQRAGRLGLAIVLRQGLTAWVMAYGNGRLNLPAPEIVQPQCPVDRGPVTSHDELVQVLAGMALARHRGGWQQDAGTTSESNC